jgi:hypothetical protein
MGGFDKIFYTEKSTIGESVQAISSGLSSNRLSNTSKISLNSTKVNNNHYINKLNCFYTYATSLNNKWNEFNAKIIELNYQHIICITETWFTLNSIWQVFLSTRPKKDLSHKNEYVII